MFRPFVSRVLLAALLCAAWVPSFAQDRTADSTLSIKDRIALISARIAAADTSRDPVAAANARLDLAALVKPSHALRLHQEVVAFADSALLPPQVALRARRGLVDLFTGMDEMTKANREWVHVLRLTEEVVKREAATALEKQNSALVSAGSRTEHLMQAMRTAKAAAQAEQARLAAEYERRTMLAMLAIAGGFLALLVSLLLFTRYIKRLRAELKEVRQEVTWLRMVGKKATDTEPVPLPIVAREAPPSPAAPAPSPSLASEEDAMLLDLVRRRGQERMKTLRDARARGDMEKVVRVVHSLKPQLVSIDPDRFAGLCSRLVGTAAAENSAQWNADLDALEAGIERTLEH